MRLLLVPARQREQKCRACREPSVVVYPDSDKMDVWVPDGVDNVMLHRADGRVPYYDQET